MCDICGHIPCSHGCPNEPDPPAVCKCDYCGDAILAGEEYIEYESNNYHEECFEDAAESILLENGAIRKTAEVEEDWW